MGVWDRIKLERIEMNLAYLSEGDGRVLKTMSQSVEASAAFKALKLHFR